MAVDIVQLCSASVEAESGQTLATVLAVCFLLYTGVTILLAGLQLYSVSNRPHLPSDSSNGSRDAPAGLASMKR